MNKFLKIFIPAIILLIAVYIYYYITLPAVNIHSPGFWFFIIGALVVICIIVGLIAASPNSSLYRGSVYKNKLFALVFSATVIVIVIYIAGSILSSPMINAKKYQQMVKISDGNFTEI